MYEFKNHADAAVPRKGSLNVVRMSKAALVHLSECPKFVTLGAHTGHLDLSPIHCFAYGKQVQLDFLVLKQNLVIDYDCYGRVYTIVKLLDSKGFQFTLVVNERSRRGFLLNPYASTPVKLKRALLLFAKRKGGACKRVRRVDGVLVPRL